MRRVLALMAIAVFILHFIPGQASGSETQADLVVWPGLRETIREDAVQIRDGIAYVPLQDAAAAFGAAAYWIDDAVVMRLLTETQSVELAVGDQTAMVDGEPMHMDSPPVRTDGKLLVSVGTLTALLGVDAEWSEDGKQLMLRESLPRLVGMEIEALPDGRQAVVLTLSKPAVGKLTEAVLTQPDRYYVDIPGVRMGLAEDDRALDVNDQVLTCVRASQNILDPPTVRVVLDLDKSFRYWARRDPTDFRRIVIEPAFKIYDAALVRNPDGGLIRIVADGGPVPYHINYYSEPDRIVVDLMSSFLVPNAFEISNDDHYFVRCIRASQNQADTVRVVIELRRSYPYTPYVPEEKPNELAIAFGKMVYAPEIVETATNIDIVIRSSQQNRGSIWHDSPVSDKMRLAIDFENSFFGFDPAAVSIQNDLISGFRAGRFDGHTVRMVFDLKRFNGYSLLKGLDNETVIRLPKTAQSVLFGKTVVIDPGHGSFPSEHPQGDPGADRSLDGKVVWEKDLNLAVALKLRDMLLDAGANPVLTRDTDTGLSLMDRCRTANREGADAFISIHHNSSRTQWTKTSGVEIYHKSGDAPSKALAESLGWALPRATGQTLAYVGVHRTFLLAVLEGSRVPSVLVEVGFMSCLDELRRLVTEDFQIRAATGMLNGLVSFFNGKPSEESQDSQGEPEAESQASTKSGADFLTELTSNLPEIDLSLVEEKAESGAEE